MRRICCKLQNTTGYCIIKLCQEFRLPSHLLIHRIHFHLLLLAFSDIGNKAVDRILSIRILRLFTNIRYPQNTAVLTHYPVFQTVRLSPIQLLFYIFPDTLIILRQNIAMPGTPCKLFKLLRTVITQQRAERITDPF